MKTDLHLHSRTGSDGAYTLEELFAEAARRGIGFLSVTDHDAVHHQGQAIELARRHGIRYVTGVELNVTFPHLGKDYALDFLGYGYDHRNAALNAKLELIREHRAARARQIIANLNREFARQGRPLFDDGDLDAMQAGIEGVLSRPHIADYLVKKGIVRDRQQAFDDYLVSGDVPKYPLPLAEASALVRAAGGILVLAHPNDPNGTSLVKITRDLEAQTNIVQAEMLDHINGIECRHSRADAATTAHYLAFCRAHGLIDTGGSDCHQKPLLLGTVDVPDAVARQMERYAV